MEFSENLILLINRHLLHAPLHIRVGKVGILRGQVADLAENRCYPHFTGLFFDFISSFKNADRKTLK
jgi:hypothetical protein